LAIFARNFYFGKIGPSQNQNLGYPDIPKFGFEEGLKKQVRKAGREFKKLRQNTVPKKDHKDPHPKKGTFPKNPSSQFRNLGYPDTLKIEISEPHGKTPIAPWVS